MVQYTTKESFLHTGPCMAVWSWVSPCLRNTTGKDVESLPDLSQPISKQNSIIIARCFISHSFAVLVYMRFPVLDSQDVASHVCGVLCDWCWSAAHSRQICGPGTH